MAVKGLSIIDYKGKKIIYADYSILGNKDEALALLEELKAQYMKEPLNSVLGMTNVQNLKFDMEVLNKMKSGEKETTPRVKKVAIVGVKGLLKAGYNFVIGLSNSPYKIFDTVEEAKEWLASEH